MTSETEKLLARRREAQARIRALQVLYHQRGGRGGGPSASEVAIRLGHVYDLVDARDVLPFSLAWLVEQVLGALEEIRTEERGGSETS